MQVNIKRLDQLMERVEQCEDYVWGNNDPNIQPKLVFGMLTEYLPLASISEPVECDSPCCLMGHITDLAKAGYPRGIMFCSNWLGITKYAGVELFVPNYLVKKRV